MRGDGQERRSLVADPRRLRAVWLQVLAEAVDGYLRSPFFLAWLRSGLATTVEAQALQMRAFEKRLRAFECWLPARNPRPLPAAQPEIKHGKQRHERSSCIAGPEDTSPGLAVQRHASPRIKETQIDGNRLS